MWVLRANGWWVLYVLGFLLGISRFGVNLVSGR